MEGNIMMKTATITFHSAENYGAFLQAFALQQFVINEFGVENKILNYVSDHMEEHYRILKKPESLQDVLRNTMMIPFSRKLYKRKKRFKRDQLKYLQLTERFKDTDGYNKIIKEFDLCIAGSDQIWNLESEDFSELFFLPNAKRKISYAASAGTTIKDEWKPQYIKYLHSFEKVCVRETNAANYFDDLSLPSGKTEICIDPTFLLPGATYRKMAGSYSLIDKPYIVYYSINNNSDSMRLASQIGKQMGLPVIAIYSRVTSIFAMKYGMHTYFEAGPCEFLNLLLNAQCVLTNSFHGTALSIILRKPFARLGLQINGEHIRDDRIDSILEMTGLENRSVWNLNDFVGLDKKINWEYVEHETDSQVNHAKSYLKRHILKESV